MEKRWNAFTTKGGMAMAMTLNDQMNILFQRGMKTVCSYKEEILKEWERIIRTYSYQHKKFAKTMEETMEFFQKYIFQEADFQTKSGQDEQGIFNTNPFVISFLENAVHKVISEKAKGPYQDHFAIHYFFTKVTEDVFMLHSQEPTDLEGFLSQMVKSRQLPIKYIALIENQNGHFCVKNIISKNPLDSEPLHEFLKADSIYGLSELLDVQLFTETSERHSWIPIPFGELTLLICLPQESVSNSLPFITFSLNIFKAGEKSLKTTKESLQWKDSVILFNEKVMGSQTFMEAVQNIANGFVEFLPFERCAIFSYNRNKQMGFGLYGRHLDVDAIKQITENIQNVPIVHRQLKLLENYGRKIKIIQPLYLKEAKGFLPDHYVEQFNLKSVVIAPIYLSHTNRLLGAAILDQGPGKYFKVDKDTYFALIKFGKSAGEILGKYFNEKSVKNQWHFSPRELEVLMLLAEGASTFEAAVELNLSEYTVRDYISAIMQKMNVKNRTEAVAKAIREGFI